MSFICGLLIAFLVPSAPQSIEFRQVLTIGPMGAGGRIPFPTNALIDDLANGRQVSPVEGAEATSVRGDVRKWRKLEVGSDGWFTSEDFSGGFASVTYDSPTERVMALEASGHSFVYVNGEPRGGDPYGFGIVRLPIQVKKGENTFLFSVGRGRLRFKLDMIQVGVFPEARDATLPDLIVGESGERHGAILVTNSTPLTMRGFVMKVRLGDGRTVSHPLPSLIPFFNLKVPFTFDVPKSLKGDSVPLHVSIVDEKGVASLDSVSFALAVKQSYQLHKRTFVSAVDGSVQYYAVQPPFQSSLATADALVLSVHGAGVEAMGQAAAYGQKSWATIVAPTNRRQFGFDWEATGMTDAMEALEDAKRIYKPREDRIYLTGHSMGGHGTWYLGAMRPDQWGAIGPAAGWINFWSYGGAVRFENPDPIEQMLLRVASVSDPLKVIENYKMFGVYVLHGDADDTVPVSQARDMRAKLSVFHRDVDFHEEPGGGHWYDTTPEPGADCVDYGPMFEFFDQHRRRLSKDVRSFSFSTVDPQTSGTCHWLTIKSQAARYLTSTVSVVNPIGTKTVKIETTNVKKLVLDRSKSPFDALEGSELSINIDGTELTYKVSLVNEIVLSRESGAWKASDGSLADSASDARSVGALKNVFNNDFVFVYGTTGTAEENAWSLAKARFDAETWWYRANGRAIVMSDRDYTGSQRPIGGRNNAVFFGNEDSNSEIARLLKFASVRLNRSSFQLEEHVLGGEDLSLMTTLWGESKALFNGSPVYSPMAIIGGTGIEGMRATNHVPYFVSGVHYPDITVFRSNVNRIGTKAIELVGLFGDDRSVENGEMVWRK